MQPSVDALWDDGPGVMAAVRRYRVWVALAGILVAALAAGLTLLRPARYEATATLFLNAPDAANVFAGDDADRRVLNQVARLRSRDVAAATAEALGAGYDTDDILDATKVDGEQDNDVITVTATAGSAEGAAALANGLSTTYMDAVEAQVQAASDDVLADLSESTTQLRERLADIEQQLERRPEDSALIAQRDAVAAQLAALSARADQSAVDASLYGSGVQLFERAVPPEQPLSQGLVRNTIAGLLLGLALGAGAAWRRVRSNPRALQRHDPAAILGIPLLGSVPKFDALGVKGIVPTISDPRSPAGEAYQFLIASIAARLGYQGGHVIAVTSPQPGDGKTVTALNLAVAASRDERDVLLVDGDARVKGLSRLTSTNDGGAGLSELQQDPDNLIWSASRRDLADAPGVEVVPIGADIADPAGFFRTKGFTGAMRRIRDHADLVVIDCPPVLAVSDALAIAEHVDAIVLVVAQGTPLPVLEEVRDRTAVLSTPLVGYVFNRADEEGAPYAYHYDQYQFAGDTADRANDTPQTFSSPPPSSASGRAPRSSGIAAMQEGPSL